MPSLKTKCRPAIVITVAPGDRELLRSVLVAAGEGVRDELDRFEAEVGDPERLRREALAYGRLLDALDGVPIARDAETREAAVSLARVVDESNEYERVVAEHAAFERLLDQLN